MNIKDEFGKSHITQQSIGSDFWFGRSLLRPLQKCPDYRLGFYQITIYNVINVKVKENGVTCSLVRAANTIRLQFGPASLRASSPGGGGGGKKGGPHPVFAPPPSYYDPWESLLAGYGPVEEILMGQPRSQVLYLPVSLSLLRVGEGVSRWVGENPGNEVAQWTLSNDDDNVKKQFSPAA